MEKVTLRQLSREELGTLYRTKMRGDFPPSELKPLERLTELTETGKYAAYGWFEDGALSAYAMTAEEEDAVLLDYLAVCAARGKGCGSRALAALAERFADRTAILGEVEAPEEAAGEERATRERRYLFYEKNGWRQTGIFVVQYGEKLQVFCRDCARCLSDGEIKASLRAYYAAIYGADYTAGKVEISDG